VNNIQNIRKSHNIHVDEMALSLGLSKSTIGHYECGRRHPDLTIIRKIVDFFNSKGIPATIDSIFPPHG